MEPSQSIGSRIKQVRGDLSQKAFGARIGLSQTAVTALENDQSEPRLGTFNAIVEAFGVNPEWLRTGRGQMKGHSEPAQPLPVAQEPAAAYTPAAYSVDPSFAQQLINELADCQKQNRLDLKQAQRDFREDLNASSKHWQYTVDRMEDTIIEQRTTIADLRNEISRLQLAAGLRLPTAEEKEALKKQIEEREKEKPTPNPIGWRPGPREEELQQPQAEEVEMAISYSNPSFTRLPEAAEQTMWVAHSEQKQAA